MDLRANGGLSKALMLSRTIGGQTGKKGHASHAFSSARCQVLAMLFHDSKHTGYGVVGAAEYTASVPFMFEAQRFVWLALLSG